MITVNIRITGTKEEIQHLNKIKSGLVSMKGSFDDIGKEVVSYVENTVFSSQGGAIGNNWPALAKSTVKRKIKFYPTYATTPLIATRTMLRNFESKATGREVVISNNSPQFDFHNSRLPRSKIPYRPMLLVNNQIKKISRTILQRDIDKLIRR